MLLGRNFPFLLGPPDYIDMYVFYNAQLLPSSGLIGKQD